MNTSNTGSEGIHKPIEHGTVATVGTFDGIHLGHRKVLDLVMEMAGRKGLGSLVVTFDVHPWKVLRPADAPRLLTTLDEKLKILSQFGLDFIEVIPFTPELARLTPREFVADILLKQFEMRELVIGYDHGFGRGREGSTPMLRSLGKEMGFALSVVPPVNLGDLTVSSSLVRKRVLEADLDFATRALGRDYTVEAEVVQGDGRGRQIGFPTANLRIIGQDKLLPPDGVYAVRVRVKGEVYRGMMHQGERPTFSGSKRSVEVHLIDFQGDLLGERVEIGYVCWIRKIQRFDSPDGLRERLARDRDLVKEKYIRG